VSYASRLQERSDIYSSEGTKRRQCTDDLRYPLGQSVVSVRIVVYSLTCSHWELNTDHYTDLSCNQNKEKLVFKLIPPYNVLFILKYIQPAILIR
jgi:hypothetical protein